MAQGKGTKQAAVSTALLKILLIYLRKQNVDIAELCESAKLDSVAPKPALLTVLESADARIPVGQFAAVWHEAVRRTGDEYFGLNFGMEMATNYPGMTLFTVMANCPTVGDALEKFLLYHDVMADAVRPVMRRSQSRTLLTWEFHEHVFSAPPHVAEALLCVFVGLLRLISNNAGIVKEVRFAHECPADLKRYESVLGCRVVFKQAENATVLRTGALKIPILLANPELLATVEEFVKNSLENVREKPGLPDTVSRRLQESMMRGEIISVDAVAAKLAMSRRNLQLKLKEEGFTYQNLLDSARRDIAMHYLKKPEVTICDITFMLGFSEQSAFCRAFKRWTGATPAEFR